MDEILNKKLNELYNLLDNVECIKKISNLSIDKEVYNLINNYRENPSIENKINLYKNKRYLEYIKNETELNYLIMAINKKFKMKRGTCENN